ncbi:MAG: hypothetical protein FJ211_10005 [Ignavibacteria bacterium]|nr:hypothetical protein [Ignavibacteria bacterium]
MPTYSQSHKDAADMLYQVSFGLNPTSYTTAMEYINADSYKDAWCMADGLCHPNEMVQDVVPVSNLDDYE